MQPLLEYLSSIPEGQIAEVGLLEGLLASCWEEFDGASAERMRAYKLHNRMENAHWDPPILSFRIARHGGTVHGSTRAELQEWCVNVKTRKAECSAAGYRQIRARQTSVDVSQLAEEIAQLIVARRLDERLNWKPDGRVRVLIRQIPDLCSGPRQTREGRRRRFRKALTQILTTHGWHEVTANNYAKTEM